MKLHELSPVAGSVKESKRKGRGHGSGNGKTAGKETWCLERPVRKTWLRSAALLTRI